MSYARKSRLRQRYAKVGGHRIALGDFIDDVEAQIGSSQSAACFAGAAATTAQLDAKIADLAQNWHPTGFYTAADMLQLIGAVQQVLHQSESMLEQVGDTAAQDQVKNAQDELFRHMAQAQVYLQAASGAGGRPVNAPGLKDYVVNAMNAASNGATAAYVIACETPWWVGALAAFQSAFDAAWSVAKRIVGVVVAAGAAVLTVAEETVGILKYLPYAAAAIGAYIVITELGRYKKRRS